jgi:hypothetical protein
MAGSPVHFMPSPNASGSFGIDIRIGRRYHICHDGRWNEILGDALSM